MIAGAASIYTPTSKSFLLYPMGRKLDLNGGKARPEDAKRLKWHINWAAANVGKSGNICAGRTSAWKWYRYRSGTAMLSVDTSHCKFKRQPVYMTSLGGNGLHEGAIGEFAIHD